MSVGITGTRKGANPLQLRALEIYLTQIWTVWRATCASMEVHHGDCIGVDAQAHEIAVRINVPRIVIHPPMIDAYRALTIPRKQDEVMPVAPYLDRDKAIVQASGILLAVPETIDENKRSGTWYTVRYARHKRRLIRLFLPDGRVVANDPKDEENA